MITGDLAPVNAGKVLTACDGLDDTACAAIETVLTDRLVGMDPARITTVTRRVATRIAADQVHAVHAKNRKDRLVQVTPGPDGSTDWWARLPAARSAAAWAAVQDLGDHYASKDPDLTLDQARADALMDLLLTNVHVTAHITLGIPILTGPDGQAALNSAVHQHAAETRTDQTTDPDRAAIARGAAGGSTANDGGGRRDDTARTGTGAADGHDGSAPSTDQQTRPAVTDRPAGTNSCDPEWVRPAFATGGLGTGGSFSLSAALLSGCEIPGIGFIDADTIENLLSIVPTHIGRALLDARTGTLMESVSTAYRPSKAVTEFVTTRDGTCRMWGCTRPARRCDIDHARPWPHGPTTPTNLGGLCRRHHRLKQHHRWTYHLDPDGTATWTSPNGTTRTTPPDHAAPPPPTPSTPAPTPSATQPATPPAPMLGDDKASRVLVDDPPLF